MTKITVDFSKGMGEVKQEVLSGAEELKLNVSLYSCYLLSLEW